MYGYNSGQEKIVLKNASSNLGVNELLKSIKRLGSKNSVIQVFDNRSILSRSHLVGAYVNTLIAFKNKTNRTKSRDMEMLLFAAFTDQIGKAIETVGIKNTSKFIIFCNDPKLLNRIKKFAKIGSNFDPSFSEMNRAAKILKLQIIGKDQKQLELKVLERMALSRLATN